MRNTVTRGLSIAALVAMSGSMMIATAGAAGAADHPGELSLAIHNSTSSTGVPSQFLDFNISKSCSPEATNHTVVVKDYVAKNPADQDVLSKWKEKNLYGVTPLGMPYPKNVGMGQSWKSFATVWATKLAAGEMTLEFRCQDELGITVYDTFTNVVHWDSDTSWRIDLKKTASTTTLTADKTSATTADSVTFSAAVAPLAATGEVEFFDGATSLGTSVVSAGKATLSKTFAAGTHSVTAKYAGSATHDASTSAAVAITVAKAPVATTTTTLAVDKTSGEAYQAVKLTGTVAPAAEGVCKFYDGTTFMGQAPVTGGTCSITTSAAGIGAHAFTAQFVPANADAFAPSTSTAVAANYVAPATLPDEQTVVVTVPKGDLKIFTPYTPANPLNLGELKLSDDGKCYNASTKFDKVTVTDTRSGNLGWAASLTRADFTNPAGGTIAADREGFMNVKPQYVAGNAIKSIDVKDIPAGGGDAAKAPAKFASAAAGASVGSVDVLADFVLDCVPTSVKPGLYTSTVVFTVA